MYNMVNVSSFCRNSTLALQSNNQNPCLCCYRQIFAEPQHTISNYSEISWKFASIYVLFHRKISNFLPYFIINWPYLKFQTFFRAQGSKMGPRFQDVSEEFKKEPFFWLTLYASITQNSWKILNCMKKNVLSLKWARCSPNIKRWAILDEKWWNGG